MFLYLFISSDLFSHNMNILENKTKSMGVTGKKLTRVKLIVNNNMIEQITDFVYLGSHFIVYKLFW